MNENESHVKSHLIRMCRAYKALCIKLSDRYRAGIPDFLIILNGKAWFVELKRPGSIPTRIQFKTGEEIRNHGGNWTWLSSKEAIDNFMKKISTE